MKKKRIPLYQLDWVEADRIEECEELFSTALHIIPLLLAIPDVYKYPRIGWYIANLKEFRVEGSPSQWQPTHFRALPALPEKENK